MFKRSPTSAGCIQLMQRCTISLAALLCSACGHQSLSVNAQSEILQTKHAPPTHLFADKGRFGTAPAIVDEAELFRLTEAQRAEFLGFMQDPRFAHQPRYKRLFDYLEQSTYNFNYRGRTYLARDAIDLKQGNCLSLAIMTTALARIADVKVAYQLIDTTPVFEVGDNAVARGVHVRSKLYRTDLEKAKDDQISSFTNTGIVVDYFPSQTTRFLGNISEQNFIARYFRNLAVEYLQNSDYNNSYWYALKAMEYTPKDEEGINLMAVIHKHAGFTDEAESIYQYGISVARSKLTLLKNYRQLLNEQGRSTKANALSQQIAEMDDPSPYNWLRVADAMFAEGSYKEALSYYKRAVRLAPYLQYGYLGMSRIFYLQGHLSRSEKMLKKAMERNYNREYDQLYRAKLAALNSRQASKISN